MLVLALGLASCQRAWVSRPATRALEPSPGVSFGQEPTIRVRIRETVTTSELGSSRALFIRLPEAREGDPRRTLVLTGPVRVSYEAGEITLTPVADDAGSGSGSGLVPGGVGTVSAGALRVAVNSGDARPLEIAPTSGELLVDGVSYPGHVRIVPRSDAGPAAFDVVATIPMEAYVAGVIARELYANWRPAAFEAQAVAARSYALHERDRARASGRAFDVESTTRDQVFGGSTQLAVAIAGARSTRGIVLIHEGEGPDAAPRAAGRTGEILRTYYSSTCGGRSAGATETWPSGPGFEFNRALPLRAHARACDCSASGLHRWTRTRNVSELSDRLRAWGRVHQADAARLAAIRSIEVREHNAVGRPVLFEIRDVRGRRVTLRAEDFRVASNWSASGAPEITRATRVPSGDAEIEIRGGIVHYQGRGFGHGVGMCQFGAQQMASTGHDWQSILGRYYPGARWRRVYP